MNKEIVYWKQRNGVLISIDDMDINHLRNVLKMIVKNSNKHKVQKLHGWNDVRANEFNKSQSRFNDDESRGNQWN
jgi:hypothetical protein